MNRIKFNRPAHKNNFATVLDDFFNTNFGDIIDNDFSRKSPGINIKESENAFIIELAAPGLKKENFNIHIEKDQLIISSKNEHNEENKAEENSENVKYKRREFNYSNFKKSFHLNKDIDITKIDAKYDAGILTVSLEKREEAKAHEPRTITVA